MRILIPALAALCLWSPAQAALDQADIPAGTLWYLHADLAALRDSRAGAGLYRWFDAEVIAEVHDETGIDIGDEIERVTAYSSPQAGVVMVVEGPIREATRDKLIAMIGSAAETDVREHGGQPYYFVGDEIARSPLDDDDEPAYVSFALPGKILVTSQEAALTGLIDSGGYIAGAGGHRGALLVLSADKSLVQGGLRADQFLDDDGDGWDSRVLRATEQAAFLLAEQDGSLVVEAKLVSNDATLTESLGSIISGVISLQAFNDELPPALKETLRTLKVTARDTLLSVSAVLDQAALDFIADQL